MASLDPAKPRTFVLTSAYRERLKALSLGDAVRDAFVQPSVEVLDLSHRQKLAIILGDKPDHPFRGNQWGDAKAVAAHKERVAQRKKEREQDQVNVKGGDAPAAKTRADQDKEEHDALVSDPTTRPPVTAMTLDPPAPPCEVKPCHPIANVAQKTIKKLGGGVNGSHIVTGAVDGTPVKMVYKPVAEEDRTIATYRNDYTEASLAEREAAAFDIDQALGLGMTPQTDMSSAKLSRGDGSVQHMVNAPNGRDAGRSEVAKIDSSQWYKLAVLDSLIGNQDRHNKNYLVKNGRLYAIDHGYAFPKTDDTNTYGQSGHDPDETSLPDNHRKELVNRLRTTDWEKVTQGRLRGKTLQALKDRAAKVANAIEAKDLAGIWS